VVDRAGQPPPRQLDRFGTVLVLVLATLIAQALIDVRASYLAEIVTRAITGAALVFAVRAGGLALRWRRAADLLVIVTLLVDLVLLAVHESRAAPGLGLNGGLLWLAAAALVPVAIARRVAEHREVGLQTVMGAVAAYLQIAVAYALLFQTIDALGASPFFGEEVPTTVYAYASLATITTLGYGDVTAVSAFGRLTMVSEAVVGQVFLVTFVALVVARFAAPGGDPADRHRPRG
jgi:Ion channel